jgi:hypothetical protein
VRGIGGAWIETLDALEYVDPEFWVVVPSGFVSDGASVPSFGWPLLRAGFVELLPAGLLHDYLYRDGALIHRGRPVGHGESVPGRLWADRVMAEAMLTRRGLTAGDARRVRLGLLLGGWASWQRKPVSWRPAAVLAQHAAERAG